MAAAAGAWDGPAERLALLWLSTVPALSAATPASEKLCDDVDEDEEGATTECLVRACACHAVPSHATVARCLCGALQATLGGMRPHGPQATALNHAWLLLTLEQSVPEPALVTSTEHSLPIAADQGAPAVRPLPRPTQAGHGETQLCLDRSRCLQGTGRPCRSLFAWPDQLPKVSGLACIRHPTHVQWCTPAWPRGPMPTHSLCLPPRGPMPNPFILPHPTGPHPNPLPTKSPTPLPQVERADDIRLERPLLHACSRDMRRFCKDVEMGANRSREWSFVFAPHGTLSLHHSIHHHCVPLLGRSGQLPDWRLSVHLRSH